MNFKGKYFIKKLIRRIFQDKKARFCLMFNLFIEFLTFGFIPHNRFQKGRKVKTILILGMHRSATSMISRALHLSGESWMGNDLMLNKPDNVRGHYEQIPIVNLNDKILRTAKGSWDNPPSHASILSLKGRFNFEIIKELECLELSSNGGTIGIKDPRMCLTIELWEPFLKNPQYIVSYRDSNEIAQSLNKRDGMPIEKGIELANEYNNRLKLFISQRF